MTLEDAGATVSSFVKAADAMTWLDTFTPSAGVLDYRVGVDKSDDIAHTLRARGVPVVFYSGLTDRPDVPEELQGCTWLTKPSSPDELVDLLHKLLA
ncbi:response regulator [Neorhizobium alkalisoli]|uniref:Response regulatory domain-containing protein n=1 Tax=Neorhizobium alkalisoli TaxID=528178 RepID=A0A561QB09_9HYPH|nr:response regulator [Neorhizobium alkalisoli]TWF47531.1 hypothetical protein FHW37_11132 [Neorhizobium alkalisoli]